MPLSAAERGKLDLILKKGKVCLFQLQKNHNDTETLTRMIQMLENVNVNISGIIEQLILKKIEKTPKKALPNGDASLQA